MNLQKHFLPGIDRHMLFQNMRMRNNPRNRDDRTLMTLTGTRDALRASCRSLNEYYEPEVEETIHK
ncbi:hypothetical protein TNCT_243421, partial [Trichonephila clavata]